MTYIFPAFRGQARSVSIFLVQPGSAAVNRECGGIRRNLASLGLALPGAAAAIFPLRRRHILHRACWAIGIGLILAVISPVAGQSPPPTELNNAASALETAARDYRIEIYNAFRHQRGEYNRRRQIGADLLAAWAAAGQPADRVDELRNWFEQARVASSAGRELPPVPQIQPDKTTQPPATPPPPPPLPLPLPEAHPRPSPAGTTADRLVFRGSSLPRQFVGPSWSQAARTLFSAIPLVAPEPDANIFHTRPNFFPSWPGSIFRDAHNDSPPRIRDLDRGKKLVAKIWLTPLELPALPEATAPAAATAGITLPALNPGTPVQSDTVAAQLNVAELAARITAYHKGCRGVQLDLLERGEWTPERIEALSEILTDLQRTYDNLRLYSKLAPPDLAGDLAALRPPTAQWQALAAQCQAAVDRLRATTRLSEGDRAALDRLLLLQTTLGERGPE
ncbi:MAG: hypothetical protein SFX18_00120 [Pirellulales bacterium]|nr:hypothetical protein [Pirellulales bacterium]